MSLRQIESICLLVCILAALSQAAVPVDHDADAGPDFEFPHPELRDEHF